jgi:hypothetical protein
MIYFFLIVRGGVILEREKLSEVAINLSDIVYDKPFAHGRYGRAIYYG